MNPQSVDIGKRSKKLTIRFSEYDSRRRWPRGTVTDRKWETTRSRMDTFKYIKGRGNDAKLMRLEDRSERT